MIRLPTSLTHAGRHAAARLALGRGPVQGDADELILSFCDLRQDVVLVVMDGEFTLLCAPDREIIVGSLPALVELWWVKTGVKLILA